MRKTLLFGLFAASVFSPIGWGHAQSQQPLSDLKRHYKHLALVIDASGSMEDEKLADGQLNWSLAKKHIAALLQEIGRETQTPVAIVNFGENQPSYGVCTQGVTHALSPGTSQQVEKIIFDISEKWIPNGKTSLAAGIELAWEELDATGGMIVVFTDLEQDNCGGDPCQTVLRLTKERDPSKPVIHLRYVVPIGDTGLAASEEFAFCSGAEVLAAKKDPDVLENVPVIMDPLRPPKDAEVEFAMSVLDPTNLGISLPLQSSAVLAINGGRSISMSRQAEEKVKGTSARVSISIPNADPMDLGPFVTAKGSKSVVNAYFTPPLVELTLPAAASAIPDIKWVLTEQRSKRQHLFSGAVVLQFIPAGSYVVEVFAGELYISGSFKAKWNSFSNHQFNP